MLRLLAGLEEPDAGTRVQQRGVVVSLLPQHPLGDERTALETVRAAHPDLDEGFDRELLRVAEQLAAPEGFAADLERMARVLSRQEELVERWEAAGGPSIEGGPRDAARPRPRGVRSVAAHTSTLSEAQRKLIALAACLARDPDVLLLDEPEAHLTDAVDRALFERLLAGFDGAALAELPRPLPARRDGARDRGLDRGIRVWPGNCSAYTLARQLELQRQQQYVTQQKEIERPRGGDPPLQALGELGAGQAQHPAGVEQAAPDRPDGEGRAARAGAADRPAPPSARAAARASSSCSTSGCGSATTSSSATSS